MTWIFDATPLIYLATIDRISLVEALDAPCLIPRPVYDAVVTTGLEAGYPDARRIERAVEDGLFEVVEMEETALSARLERTPTLSAADVSVLSLAAARDATAVMDERYGRTVADIEGIETRGTAYLVLVLVKYDRLGADEAREIIDQILDAGWYCAPPLYAKLLEKLDELA